MNSLIKVNIAGLAFTLTAEAYQRLQNYLDFLNSHYNSHEQKYEIIEGIEERISELFLSKCPGDAPITIEPVEEVIRMLGDPEVLQQEDVDPIQQGQTYKGIKRKLYRDPNHKVIGGLLSGIAHYLRIRPIFIRLAFIFIFILLNKTIGLIPQIDHTTVSILILLVAYLGLCVYIPVAKTIEEQWQMMGEASDINSIQNLANPHISHKQTFNPKRSDSLLGNLITAFIKLIGGILILTAAAVLTLIIVVFFCMHLSEGISWIDVFKWIDIQSPQATYILLFLAFAIPSIAVLYVGTKFVFGFKSPKWKPMLIMALAFVVVTTTLALLTFPTAKHYTGQGTFPMQQDTIRSLNSDTLTLIRVFPKGTNPSDYAPLKGDSRDACIYINTKNKTLILFPFLNIDADNDSIRDLYVSYQIKAFYKQTAGEETPVISNHACYSVEKNQIYLYGRHLSYSSPWNRQIDQLELRMNPKTVIIRQ